jgi:hypothetical protein
MVSEKIVEFLHFFIPAVLTYALLFIVAIILHEASHAIHHRIVLKRWPKFGFTKRLELVYVLIEGQMTIYQMMMNIVIAVFVGAVFVSWFENWVLWFTYIFACSYDVNTFIKLWRRGNRYGYHRTMDEVIEFEKLE